MPPRRISIPASEREYLATLSGPALRARARELHAAGWTLAAIGDALVPSRPRSTIRFWVSSSPSASAASSTISAAEKAPLPVPSPSHTPSPPLPSSSPSSASTIAAAEKSPLSLPRSRSRPFTASSAVLSPGERSEIARLAPVARRYRAGANPSGAIATANDELTALCRAAHRRGASIPELADAAGVTYKAMERRIKGSRS